MVNSFKASALAGLAALIVNLVVLFLGNVPQSVLTPVGQPINAVAVMILSFVPVLLAGWLYHLLMDRLWLYQALVIALAVVSMVAPFQLEAAPGTMVATLLVMHLVVGGSAAFLIPMIAETLAAED